MHIYNVLFHPPTHPFRYYDSFTAPLKAAFNKQASRFKNKYMASVQCFFFNTLDLSQLLIWESNAHA